MNDHDLSIFEFRRLPIQERQCYLNQAKKLLPGGYTDSIIEVLAANLWAKDKAKHKKSQK